MHTKDLLNMILLCGCVFLLSSCAMDIVEPPSLTLDDPPSYETPGGNPSEWGSGEVILPILPSETRQPPPVGGNPSDWGSGEPIMTDGTCPHGQTVAGPKKYKGAYCPEENAQEKQYFPKQKKKQKLYDPWLVEEDDIRDYIPKVTRPQTATETDSGTPCDSGH